jgi:hypothetical protein
MNEYNLLCIICCSFGAFFYGSDSGLTTYIIGYPAVIYHGNQAPLTTLEQHDSHCLPSTVQPSGLSPSPSQHFSSVTVIAYRNPQHIA